MVQDIDYTQVMQYQFKREPIILFFHTPLCGTCKLARQMLEVSLSALDMEDAVPVKGCNLNHMPRIAREWSITSVPCLLYMKDGRIVNKVYSFQSVDKLYHELRNFNQMTEKTSG